MQLTKDGQAPVEFVTHMYKQITQSFKQTVPELTLEMEIFLTIYFLFSSTSPGFLKDTTSRAAFIDVANQRLQERASSYVFVEKAGKGSTAKKLATDATPFSSLIANLANSVIASDTAIDAVNEAVTRKALATKRKAEATAAERKKAKMANDEARKGEAERSASRRTALDKAATIKLHNATALTTIEYNKNVRRLAVALPGKRARTTRSRPRTLAVPLGPRSATTTVQQTVEVPDDGDTDVQDCQVDADADDWD